MRALSVGALLLLAGAPLLAQDTLGVRLGITYTAGTRPGLVILPSAGLDSVRAILARDLDYSDRFEVPTSTMASIERWGRPTDWRSWRRRGGSS